MPFAVRRLALLTIAALSLSLAAAGCSTDDTASTTLEIEVVIASQESTLHEVGPDGERVYGWNRLTGEAEVDGESTAIEMLATVDYVDGAGDFFGFVTVTFADGSLVSLRMEDGETEAATATSGASFTSDLEVVGGTGPYEEATGSGTFEGSRDEALGGAVDSVFEIELELPSDD